MACSCGRTGGHLDAILLGGPWDGRRFRVHDPPEQRISVPHPPPPASFDPDPALVPDPVPVTSYRYAGIRDDGLRVYRPA